MAIEITVYKVYTLRGFGLNNICQKVNQVFSSECVTFLFLRCPNQFLFPDPLVCGPLLPKPFRFPVFTHFFRNFFISSSFCQSHRSDSRSAISRKSRLSSAAKDRRQAVSIKVYAVIVTAKEARATWTTVVMQTDP